MVRFVIRRLLSLVFTMIIVSMVIFLVSEAAPGDVAKHILGQFVTPEQLDLFRAQLGLSEPLPVRYMNWLLGTDWRASRLIGYPLERLRDPRSGMQNWWADVDGELTRWTFEEGELYAIHWTPEGKTIKDDSPITAWKTDSDGRQYFWGLDAGNHATLWVRGEVQEKVGPASAGRMAMEQTGGVQYIPLQRGLLRGDPGVSFRTGRPVSASLFLRLRNSAILAAVAFVIVMPLALVLGVIAGLNEGKLIDRVLTAGRLVTTASPSFASGIFLILIFAIWLKALPGAVVLLDDRAIFDNPAMLVLPVATLTLIELGYVLRITRASMVDVMHAPYIRTAFLQGLPYHRIVWKHALRNALMAPITVIMLHVNWLMGGIVVVEVLFSYPGLGRYLLDSALFNDVYAVEAGAMLMVILAVGTQLVADIIYTFLNPRIRYA